MCWSRAGSWPERPIDNRPISLELPTADPSAWPAGGLASSSAPSTPSASHPCASTISVTPLSFCRSPPAHRHERSLSGRTHVSAIVLDRYGHLLPGSENRVNDELDRLAATALATMPRMTTIDTEDADEARRNEAEQPVSLRIVRARSAHAGGNQDLVGSKKGPSPGNIEWAQRDSNPRPQPCESAQLVFYCPACGTEVHLEQGFRDRT
jgi:hypothetical protein